MEASLWLQDAIIHQEVLADAQALASAWQRPLESRAGRDAVRVELAGGATHLELPLPRTDFDSLDLFAFVLSTPQSVTVRCSLAIDLTTRTSGLPKPDHFRSGPAEPVSSEDWREWLVPFENFLIYGIAPGVRGVAKVVLTLQGSGPVWVHAWCGMRRARAQGSRLTDAGLLNALDLERPDLGHVRAHAGDSERALGALLEHFRTRQTPRHIYATGAGDPAEAPIAEADAICTHVINGFDVGTPVNWRANPNGYLEWQHAFNRTGFFMKLLYAYRRTREPRYVRKLDELFQSWIAANPEPVGHNGGGDPAWETLSTAVRVYGSWLECFFALLHDPNFSDAARLAMLKSFHGHAEHLMAYRGYGNNWLIVESRVLALLGMLFPEFKRGSAWADEGIARLEGELGKQIMPDGADWEFAPGYHMMAVAGFLDVYEVAKLNGRSLPPLYDERLPCAFEYIAGLTRPDGTLPSINDSHGYRHGRGRAFLERGARIFNRPDLLAGPEGPYAGRSRGFPDSGLHVLASGTGREARWLLFDAGPFGASHQHEDALSLELFAGDAPFLVDPGITSYLQDDWTAFYRRTHAHSTVLVNGAEQNRRAVTPHHHAESVREQVVAACGPVFDCVRATYRDGYAGQPAGLVHERIVVFVRPDYYLVFDEVRGAAAQSLEALWHFAPMRVELEARTHRARTMRLKGPNLEVATLDPRSGIKADLICGQRDPVQGWVSDGGEDVPAPVLSYTVKGAAPLRLATALVPYFEGLDAGLEVARLPKMPPGVLGIKLTFRDGHSDRIYLRQDPSARLPGQPVPLDADVRVERFDARGRKRAAAWLKDSKMTVEA
ncbi:MAG: alginate lyase family protein [Planctomycetes bacterium]|nr:alginate lyase family protein [Planctomycetota bacterium]